MAKAGLHWKQAQALLRGTIPRTGWSLCIGAGTSLPMFPSWPDLVKGLIEVSNPHGNAAALRDNLLDQYAPDAVIQAAQDRLGLDDDQFLRVLADSLYRSARRTLGDKNWNYFQAAFEARIPASIHLNTWDIMLHLVQRLFPGCSALEIALIVSELAEMELRPSAILSFNAEPLLYALINDFYAIAHKRPGDRYDAAAAARAPLDQVVGVTSLMSPERIPYYFCHGLLTVPGEKEHDVDHIRATSVDRLVFSESDYLNIASGMFSWQSAAFTSNAVSRPIVFIGVSLSDVNIRRWLSWIHEMRVAELETTTGLAVTSTTHYWLRCQTGTPDEDRWIGSIVAHLGVRLIWLDTYADVGPALRSLLGMKLT
ncbi:MAG: SIR2 family protein [Terriglobales bacterium]